MYACMFTLPDRPKQTVWENLTVSGIVQEKHFKTTTCTYPPWITILNIASTHGRYIA